MIRKNTHVFNVSQNPITFRPLEFLYHTTSGPSPRFLYIWWNGPPRSVNSASASRHKNVQSSGQNLSLVSQPGLLMSSIFAGFSISACPKVKFFMILARLLPAPKTSTKTSLPKSIKISINHTLGAQCFNFDAIVAPFGPPFSFNFRGHLNLLNCNR